MKQAIAEAFRQEETLSPWERGQVQAQQQSAQSLEKGHGRVEHRYLTCTTMLNDYLGWPGVRQVFRLQRQRTVKGRTTVEEAYGLTSLSPAQADAQVLLALVREHWGIENRLHWVRDMTFGEDACRVRSGQLPQFLAACRNLAITLLHRNGAKNKAAALRYYNAKPHEALALIRGSPEN